MADIEVNVFNQKLKLSYREEEKQRILKAVEVLNNNWNKFSHLHGKVSDLKIATLISLELQDSIENINVIDNKVKVLKADNELLKKQINLQQKESEEINKTLKKLDSELNTKNKEYSNFENIVDELLNELLEIKNNIVK
mgnify:CR=1 FL=1